MGGNRKNKGPQSNNRNKNTSGVSVLDDKAGSKSVPNDHNFDKSQFNNQSNNHNSIMKDCLGSSIDVSLNTDFTKVLQEVEGSAFRVTWKELAWLVAFIVMLASLSIYVGITAGITISIHYFEHNQNNIQYLPPSYSRMEARERYLQSMSHQIQRMTILDPNILSQNIMTPSSSPSSKKLDLGRVITTTESGQRNVLLVVEEIDQIIQPGSTHATSSNQYGRSGRIIKNNADFENQSDDKHGTNHRHQQNEKYSYPLSQSQDYKQQQSTKNHHSTATTTTGSNDNDTSEFISSFPSYYQKNKSYHQGPPNIELSEIKVLPSLCKDGYTIGFDNWSTLKAAIEEANALSAERFMKWNEYFASLDNDNEEKYYSYHEYDDEYENDKQPRKSASSGYVPTNNHHNSRHKFNDPSYYYEEDVIFTICPGATLRARRGPIYINAENIIIECGDSDIDDDSDHYYNGYYSNHRNKNKNNNRNHNQCIINVGGTHLAFGAHARNILVRGITFKHAHTSSLAFHYDGAQATFEDCIWIDNTGVHGSRYGAVADVNSTSTVNFSRCEISFAGSTTSSTASNSVSPGGSAATAAAAAAAFMTSSSNNNPFHNGDGGMNGATAGNANGGADNINRQIPNGGIPTSGNSYGVADGMKDGGEIATSIGGAPILTSYNNDGDTTGGVSSVGNGGFASFVSIRG